MRRLLSTLVTAALVTACTVAGSSPSPSAATAIETPSQMASVVASARPTPTQTSEPTQPPTSAPTLVTGWPTVSRSGITFTGVLLDEPPPFKGCPAPGPAVTLEIMVTGLAPGESVSLVGTGIYDFATLGCGVQPSPCQWGTDTTDPTLHRCRPEYAEAAKGTATTTAQATAEADGTASTTVSFVMPQSVRVCPAGPAHPWYVMSGEWRLRVTDKAHGLRLVGPPDLIIGP